MNAAKPDAQSLGRAIDFVERGEVRKHAAEPGERIEQEDGPGTAVDRIDQRVPVARHRSIKQSWGTQ